MRKQMYQRDVYKLLSPAVRGSQRWGQAIVNTYELRGDTADRLWFETDPANVEQLMREYFLNNQIPVDRNSV